jgi:hypothetical protein
MNGGDRDGHDPDALEIADPGERHAKPRSDRPRLESGRIGDFNADAKSDILWRHDGGIRLMDGAATLAASSPGALA